MISIAAFAVALCATVVGVWRNHRAGKAADVAYVAWGAMLFWCVGVTFVLVGIMHAYFQPLAAPSIGWQPSPFEYELGWVEIPLGLVACAAWWRGYEFRVAATLIFATFSFAAAAQHLQEIACCKNYAPNNAGPTLWFGDLVLPILLLAAGALSRRRVVP